MAEVHCPDADHDRIGAARQTSYADRDTRTEEIYVTRPYLPPLEELHPFLRDIWQSRVITNGGPFHQKLEEELCDYLGVRHISLFTNATIALITALKALSVSGEVVTTPYSFVATSHALLWNNITPVFADIDPETFNIDPAGIEKAITSRTTAIMPVHCYGHPCDVREIGRIATKRGLRTIYDAAHAFGVSDDSGVSILSNGDLSVLSFHATKVFNTFEGGAIVCHDPMMKARIDNLKNFGFEDEITVSGMGINGKMSEFSAALGLVQLRHMPRIIDGRRRIDERYRSSLQGVAGIKCLEQPPGLVRNYAYFPILVGEDYPVGRDVLYHILKSRGIHTRRYFYPLITTFPVYERFGSGRPERLPIANRVAQQVLCLPIYPDLEPAVVDEVCMIIAQGGSE